MKTILPRRTFVALLLALVLPLRAFAQEHTESPLHTEMEGMNHALRQISRQYTDPAQKASTLDLVAELQKHAETAKTLTPPKSEKMSPDDQAKYLDTFHKDLDALLKEIGLLKDAISADKTDIARSEIEKLAQLKESSHKELGVGGGGGHKHAGPPPAGQ